MPRQVPSLPVLRLEAPLRRHRPLTMQVRAPWGLTCRGLAVNAAGPCWGRECEATSMLTVMSVSSRAPGRLPAAWILGLQARTLPPYPELLAREVPCSALKAK